LEVSLEDAAKAAVVEEEGDSLDFFSVCETFGSSGVFGLVCVLRLVANGEDVEEEETEVELEEEDIDEEEDEVEEDDGDIFCASNRIATKMSSRLFNTFSINEFAESGVFESV
jgi:hypothetical protein